MIQSLISPFPPEAEPRFALGEADGHDMSQSSLATGEGATAPRGGGEGTPISERPCKGAATVGGFCLF